VTSPDAARLAALPAAKPAVALAGASYTYPRGQVALEDVHLDVPPGTRLGIFGPNGGGKSTLLRLVLGLLSPQEGRVEVFGRPPHDAVRDGLVGYVAQRQAAELRAPLSVRQVVAMTAAHGVPAWAPLSRAATERVERVMELAGVADLAERPIGALSGGQQQRVFIARALAGAPRLLLLDEPTVGIDRAGRERFTGLLAAAHAELGVTLLLVTHNLQLIAATCDRIAVLARTLHYHDTPGGLTPEVLTEVFRHDIAHDWSEDTGGDG